MTLHSAKGLEFPMVILAGLEEGLFPHSRSSNDADELEEERRLCYVGMTRARTRLVLTGAARRRVFGEYQASNPSQFIDEVPSELIDRIEPRPSPQGSRAYQSSFYAFRTNPYSRGRRVNDGRGQSAGSHSRANGESPYDYKYEDEDQSTGMTLRPGMRVRHPLFGVGSVISIEPVTNDIKLVVRFAAVGQKTLHARYARLEPA
jgi:DNA helicase-2/ATP-dependent DNA helicase PcrA